MEDKKTIDYARLLRLLWSNKLFYGKVLGVVFVLSCIYILSIPRGYFSETKVAPESEGADLAGGISSIVASFGFDLADMQSNDAITPLIYPELMNDNGFVAGLFPIHVKSIDGEIDTDYFDYMKTKQKAPWWSVAVSYIKNIFTSKPTGAAEKLDPYRLSKKDDEVVKGIQGCIKIKVDKKLGVITISTQAQDPLIAKTIADSTREHLQRFITRYRTNKARKDYEYYKDLAAQAKHDYEKARQLYASYADANFDVTLTSFKSKIDDLENEMQLRFNAYTAVSTQLQAAKAKVQERTPAFTLVQGACVPVKAESPKRMIFVAFMLFVAFIATTVYIVRKDSKQK